MQEKTVTLTPNKRLSRHLQKQFCSIQKSQNKKSWPTKKILPIDAWLGNCWREISDPRTQINQYQERALWQKIIYETLGAHFLYLVDPAINFNKLINNWNLENIDDFPYQKELDLFKNVYKNFRNHCKNKKLITLSEVATHILPYLNRYKDLKITLAGFDEYYPQLQKLINTMAANKIEITYFDPNNITDSIQKCISFDNLKQELTSCAKWTKKILKDDPNHSIGIIVPNLTSIRSEISNIFNQTLENSTQINISAGTPLANIPIIKCATNILSLICRPDPIVITQITNSPYTTQGLSIQKTTDKEIAREKFTGSECSQLFANILKDYGYPGKNALTDLENVAVNKLLELLHEIATTTHIIGKISVKEWLNILQDFITNTQVQTEPEKEAPVNIFGILEGAGINFDHLWIMGLDETSWPPPPKPNPLLPIAVQRKLSLPHSSAERELEFCQALINRYKRSAPEVVFSYVKHIDDQLVAPSSLIANIPEIAIDDWNLDQTLSWAQKIFNGRKIEPVSDDQAPQVSPTELNHAGSRLIELQSLCPFRAFMEFRLLTPEPQKLSLGISKMDRGVLIHDILEKFWSTIKTQEELRSLDLAELKNILTNCIKAALDQLNLTTILYDLEKKCLTQILHQWLLIEKNRAPFTVVATEKSVQITLASIPIKLRIDRIDQLGDGKKLLIDYKTGKKLPSIFDWFGKRPKNPQLILYALALNSVQGLALAQINPESIKFKEISLDELIFGLKTVDQSPQLTDKISWNELITYWQNILTNLAKEFSLGIATPQPISRQVCQQCSFGSVCRINQAV